MESLKHVKLGILGMGTVASGLINIMEFNKDKVHGNINGELMVNKVLVNNPNKIRNVNLPKEVYTTDAYEVINSDADIIVELIGGLSPAYGTTNRCRRWNWSPCCPLPAPGAW